MTDYQTAERMSLKEKAIPLPDLAGKSVLDVGCDHGHWCWLATDRGAEQIVGIDRGRVVRGKFVDLAALNSVASAIKKSPAVFRNINLGKQWWSFGRFDVVFCFSMYHHAFEQCGDHRAIWFWLWLHTRGELLWENPTGTDDDVVLRNVSPEKHAGYNRDDILSAAEGYFDIEEIGPALHVGTREVWRCKPLKLPANDYRGALCSGGGGATLAFMHEENRRMAEIASILGQWPFPGTLNARLDRPFDWDRNYFRAQLLDCVDRSNRNSEWTPRWGRLYPLTVNGLAAHAFRFEGENYAPNYIEFIAPVRLRDTITGVFADVRDCEPG